jgi:DNA repair protein RadC
MILVHNHPSGTKEFSYEDRQTTKRMKEAGELIGIHLKDHIVIARDEYISAKELGLV